jgi:hypothetical protein
MAYTSAGLRLSRTVGGTTTNYVWDTVGPQPVVIDDGSQYIYGNGLVEHVTASGTFYSLHDGLGSTIDLVDSNGAIVQSYEYDAFGAVRSQSGRQPTEYPPALRLGELISRGASSRGPAAPVPPLFRRCAGNRPRCAPSCHVPASKPRSRRCPRSPPDDGAGKG